VMKVEEEPRFLLNLHPEGIDETRLVEFHLSLRPLVNWFAEGRSTIFLRQISLTSGG
jgi:hypothetical protein